MNASQDILETRDVHDKGIKDIHAFREFEPHDEKHILDGP
jgi:hypothetical protein